MKMQQGVKSVSASSNRRNTVQRNMVLAAVTKLANHPSADEVYTEVAKLHPDISKATVYRNLNVLAQEGMLRRICVANAADRFDYNISRHYHLKCTRCGEFSDLELPYMHDLDSRIETQTGYTLNNHDIVFEGLCPVCKNCLKQS